MPPQLGGALAGFDLSAGAAPCRRHRRGPRLHPTKAGRSVRATEQKRLPERARHTGPGALRRGHDPSGAPNLPANVSSSPASPPASVAPLLENFSPRLWRVRQRASASRGSRSAGRGTFTPLAFEVTDAAAVATAAAELAHRGHADLGQSRGRRPLRLRWLALRGAARQGLAPHARPGDARASMPRGSPRDRRYPGRPNIPRPATRPWPSPMQNLLRTFARAAVRLDAARKILADAVGRLLVMAAVARHPGSARRAPRRFNRHSIQEIFGATILE